MNCRKPSAEKLSAIGCDGKGGLDSVNISRVTLFAGHYGSGKTNIAVNYAKYLAALGSPVTIADLDIVNPYFRTADSEQELAACGIRLIRPVYANTNLDLPALPAEMYDVVRDTDRFAVLDVGGDDRGAFALGRYTPSILEENRYEMLYVTNFYRPLTRTPEEALEVMREIECACGIRFTALINNSNLGEQTTPETIWETTPQMKRLSAMCGLPVKMTTVRKTLVPSLSDRLHNLFALELQAKYYE